MTVRPPDESGDDQELIPAAGNAATANEADCGNIEAARPVAPATETAEVVLGDACVEHGSPEAAALRLETKAEKSAGETAAGDDGGAAGDGRTPESQMTYTESVNEAFLGILRPITYAVTILFVAFAAIDLFTLTGTAATVGTLANLSVAISSFIVWRLTLAGKVSRRAAHPAGVAIIMLITMTNLSRLALIGDPWQVTETMLVLFGVGSVALSAFWFRLTLVAILAAWVPVALQVLPQEHLRQFGVTIFATAGLAVVIHYMRLRTHERMRRLRLQDEHHQRAMHEALEAAEREIAERKRSESELRDSEARYRKLVDVAPVGICVHRRGEILFANAAAAGIIGATNESLLIGRSIFDFVHPESRDELAERMIAVADERKTTPMNALSLVRLDGKRCEVETAAAPVVYQGSEANQAILIDITERKKTHERLQLVQYVMDHGGDPILWFDNDSRVVYANRVACETFGYSAEEMVELRVKDLDPEFDAEEAREMVEAIVQGRTVILERLYRRKDGSPVPVEITANRRKYQGTDINIVIARDISERKRVEAQRRESDERFRNIFEHAPLGMAIIDASLRLVKVNPAICAMFGYTEEELIGASLMKFLTPEMLEKKSEAISKLLRNPGEAIDLEGRQVRKDDSELYIQVHATITHSEGGLPKYGLAMVEDITEQKRAEEENLKLETQLRQAQKMEAVGTLAGGIAHDFNNLLTGILGYSSMLKVNSDVGEMSYKAASVIESAAERARDLTSQLLGFARQGKHQSVPIDLHETVGEIVTLLSRTIDKKVRVDRRLNAANPTIIGDPGQLQQVFLNLAVNARDAMPDGGCLTFETEVVDLDAHYCQRKPGAMPGRYLMIAVTDTGCGIPREQQERIFDPFFTTKPIGKGTGMGLAMVYGIIKNHGGLIDVYSEVNSGSTFRVYLPAATTPSEAACAAESRPPVEGAGRILIVDDEEIVRELASDILRQLGYTVVACTGGQEALEYFEAHHAEVDLAIIDMIMPEMGGRECFHKLRSINPKLKAILSTGYTRDGAAQEILNEGMIGFAQKPYRMNQLSELVAEALS